MRFCDVERRRSAAGAASGDVPTGATLSLPGGADGGDGGGEVFSVKVPRAFEGEEPVAGGEAAVPVVVPWTPSFTKSARAAAASSAFAGIALSERVAGAAKPLPAGFAVPAAPPLLAEGDAAVSPETVIVSANCYKPERATSGVKGGRAIWLMVDDR